MGRGNGQKRRFSAGTKFMLGLLVIVLCGSAVVLGRLSSGATVDLGKLQMNILDLQETFAPETEQRPAATIPAEQQNMTQPAAATAKPANGNEQIPENAKASYTLTIGGSISLEGFFAIDFHRGTTINCCSRFTAEGSRFRHGCLRFFTSVYCREKRP